MIINRESLEWLKEQPEDKYDCVVTSPPYWGLRDYGGEEKQLGLESTPEEYVNNLCDVFDEVHRTLKDNGTLWLNLGDSYASGKPRYSTVAQSFEKKSNEEDKYGALANGKRHCVKGHPILKDKDLVGIPWRVAFELQRRGWYLRQDIIWAKPNPMPESVKDRFTKSHEHIFLLTKNPTYYFDYESVMEDAVSVGKRRKRDVWNIPTAKLKEAHFAVFPEALVEPCILAGCPEGGLVLDPFSGAATTGVVAKKHNREYEGIELNAEYCKIAEERLNK